LTVRKIHCVFPPVVLEEPLFHRISRDFNIVTNIRAAEVSEDSGFMDLELEGDPEEVDRVISYLQEKGVNVTDLS
jgi:L-aspartate semialdehyde sulfurtransferase ferredoxin